MNITSYEARYLKHSAKVLADLRVSFQILRQAILIHICNLEFKTYRDALHFVQYMIAQIPRPIESHIDIKAQVDYVLESKKILPQERYCNAELARLR